MNSPTLLITLGDVAGIGPEIVAKAWPKLLGAARPIIVGDPEFLRAALHAIDSASVVEVVANAAAAHPTPYVIPVIRATKRDLTSVQLGQVSAEAGGAAYDFVIYAIDETLAGRSNGIVTCPLHKEGLHAAGIEFPGHTEILAHRTGAKSHAMLLYDEEIQLAVAHVTLHMALRDTFPHISIESVLDKIKLLKEIIPRLTGNPARVGVAALNPHASDGGLFGDEEERIIAPAVEAAKGLNIDATGPIASDAIFLPHWRARFNGIVAMYHDQGHIAMKLLGGRRAVNVTAGLPIVRTSVAHGTAYDIAGQYVADESSLISAVHVAARLAARR